MQPVLYKSIAQQLNAQPPHLFPNRALPLPVTSCPRDSLDRTVQTR